MDRLEKKGLVIRERNPKAARSVLLRLTAAGKKLMSGAYAAHARRRTCGPDSEHFETETGGINGRPGDPSPPTERWGPIAEVSDFSEATGEACRFRAFR